MIKTAAAGGNADQITAALTNSLVSSGTNAAIGTALKDVDPQTGKVLGATISGAINNGAEGAAKGAINALISEASKPNVSPTGGVRALPPDQVAALTGDQITDNANLLLPLEEAPPLPDNTVTEVLTNAGLVDGSRDDDLISPASSDKAFQDALDRSTTGNIATIDKPIENVLTDAGLVTDEEPPFTVEVVGSTLIPLIPLEEAPPLPDNTVTEVDLTKPDYVLDPVTITGERLPPDEEPPLISLEEAPPLPDNTVKEVVADTPDVPVIPKTPVAPVKPTIPVKPTTPVKPTAPVVPTAPNASTAPSEQLYQTTTQTQPTTLAGINYYLDMTGADILPPKTPVNPLESLLNQSSQPISLDELLRYLRS
jgi:hypothetical protein